MDFLKSKSNIFFSVSIVFLLAFVVLGIVTDTVYIWSIPLLLVTLFFVIRDIRWLYYIFFLVLPFTIEYYLPSGTGIDLPGELLLLLLTGLTLIYYAANFSSLDLSVFKNPISKIIFIQLGWILFTSLFSSFPIVSFKIFAAKFWYIIPMYFLTALVMTKNALKIVLRNLIVVTAIMIVYAIVRHAATGFDFSTINRALQPFFRNHVTYASLLTITFPFLFLMAYWHRGRLSRIIVYFGIMLFLAGIFLSFTRAAYVAVFAMAGFYIIIKIKMLKPALIVAVIAVIIVFLFLLRQDNYLNYSPDFEKTITYDDFDDIVNATYKGTDLSTVERGYRWVAGYQMVKERPFIGFGPGTFYFNYKTYTLKSFETYVSDNPEKSGIHSYYIMTFVEQGIVGFLILILLVFYSLIYGENLYHRLEDKELKLILMAVMLSFLSIYLILLINDMIESIKVGTIFYFNLALLLLIEKWGNNIKSA